MSLEDQRFTLAVSRFVQAADGNRTKLAVRFGASLPTVDRWALGINRPHTELQPDVIAWIEEQD